METNRVGSMVTWFFNADAGELTSRLRPTSDTEAFGRFHRAMLDQGVWLPPSQFEAAFLGTAHTAADIDFTVEAARKAFASMHAANRLGKESADLSHCSTLALYQGTTLVGPLRVDLSQGRLISPDASPGLDLQDDQSAGDG